MRVTVDLNRCEDHGQCVFSAPAVFSLDDDGRQAFRQVATTQYRSDVLPDELRADVEEAVDVCPLQAISLEE
jgi:ferredoxin